MDIRLITGEADSDALFAFRYKIYVEEMGRPQKYADHKTCRISDPLDDTGYNFAAYQADRIVGCVRVNLAKDGGLEYYRTLLGMDEVGSLWPGNVSLCTRLMVAPEFRGTMLAAKLASECYRLGLNHEVIVNYIDCNDHLTEFFARLGYEFARRVHHEEYGPVNAMRFWLTQETQYRAPSRLFA
jgi:predicted GNAT family N-acyltransferase